MDDRLVAYVCDQAHSSLARAARILGFRPDQVRVLPVDGSFRLADLGLQLTRNTRALKVWLSLRAFGLDAFRAAIDRSLDLAELARRRVEESDVLEPMAPPSLGVACFRRRWDGTDDERELERRNVRLVSALEESGIALASSTRLHGRYAIRLCILSHTSGPEHVEAALDFLEQAEVEAGPASAAAAYDRHRDVTHTFVAALEPDGSVLGALPLFEHLSGAETERALGLAAAREVVAGETVIEQWDLSRDVFVLVSGTVEVRVDGELVRKLEAGDFSGELAALDRGAGFGDPRLATVVATSAVRLLVYPDGALNRLVSELPAVAAVIRAAVAQRLEH